MKDKKSLFFCLNTGTLAFCFGLCLPYHLHLMEFNSLFAWSWGFLTETISSSPWGLFAYLGAFMTQFFYYVWTGAVTIALTVIVSSVLCLGLFKNRNSISRLISIVPSLLIIAYLCTENPSMSVVAAFLVLLAIARIIVAASGRQIELLRNRLIVSIISTLIIISSLTFIVLCPAFRNENQSKYLFMARMNQWNKLMMAADQQSPEDPLSIACLNLALCHSGRMEYNMFDYYQTGIEGLIPSDEANFSAMALRAQIYLSIGDYDNALSAVQKAIATLPKGIKSAELCKTAAAAAQLSGDVQLADKYHTLLGKTLFYKGQAEKIALEDADRAQAAYCYHLAELLLKKEIVKFSQELDVTRYNELPKAYQQALLIVWDDNHRAYDAIPSKVTSKEAEGIDRFKQAIQERHGAEYMARYFGTSYWIYYYE